jgi:hypothetical protein
MVTESASVAHVGVFTWTENNTVTRSIKQKLMTHFMSTSMVTMWER